MIRLSGTIALVLIAPEIRRVDVRMDGVLLSRFISCGRVIISVLK